MKIYCADLYYYEATLATGLSSDDVNWKGLMYEEQYTLFFIMTYT